MSTFVTPKGKTYVVTEPGESLKVSAVSADGSTVPPSGPAVAAQTVTPGTALTAPSRGIYVGGAGDVSAVIGGTTVIFKAVPVGTILPIVATLINTSGTTATYLIALQ